MADSEVAAVSRNSRVTTALTLPGARPSAGQGGDGPAARLSFDAVKEGLCRVRWASLVVTCLVCFPLMAVGKFGIAARASPLLPNDPNHFLPYDEDSQLPFASVYGWSVPACFLLLACELWAPWRRAAAADRVAAGLQLAFATLEGCFLNAAITEMCKAAFATMRPDFQDRCLGVAWPDVLPNDTDTTVCTGDDRLVEDGRRSFPSGHQSMAVAIAFFVALYFAWSATARRPHAVSRCAEETLDAVGFLGFAPMAWAFWVGVTRVEDARHSVADIVFGVVIGLVASTFCFVRVCSALSWRWSAPAAAVKARGIELKSSNPLAAGVERASPRGQGRIATDAA